MFETGLTRLEYITKCKKCLWIYSVFMCILLFGTIWPPENLAVMPNYGLPSGLCRETTLTGESRFHISSPKGIWTWFPCDGKQTGCPLDQWDMVRMKWDCRLCSWRLKKMGGVAGKECETQGEKEKVVAGTACSKWSMYKRHNHKGHFSQRHSECWYIVSKG